MRFYEYLLTRIDRYQVENFVPNRTGAIIELIRLGLKHQNEPSEIEHHKFGSKTPYVRLNIPYPTPLLERIIEYQKTNDLPTRSAAISELIQIGLQHPL
jgi:metal-responsive CopG/Arc/MetJ family transcriptional regulator